MIVIKEGDMKKKDNKEKGIRRWTRRNPERTMTRKDDMSSC